MPVIILKMETISASAKFGVFPHGWKTNLYGSQGKGILSNTQICTMCFYLDSLNLASA